MTVFDFHNIKDNELLIFTILSFFLFNCFHNNPPIIIPRSLIKQYEKKYLYYIKFNGSLLRSKIKSHQIYVSCRHDLIISVEAKTFGVI